MMNDGWPSHWASRSFLVPARRLSGRFAPFRVFRSERFVQGTSLAEVAITSDSVFQWWVESRRLE